MSKPNRSAKNMKWYKTNLPKDVEGAMLRQFRRREEYISKHTKAELERLEITKLEKTRLPLTDAMAAEQLIFNATNSQSPVRAILNISNGRLWLLLFNVTHDCHVIRFDAFSIDAIDLHWQLQGKTRDRKTYTYREHTSTLVLRGETDHVMEPCIGSAFDLHVYDVSDLSSDFSIARVREGTLALEIKMVVDGKCEIDEVLVNFASMDKFMCDFA